MKVLVSGSTGMIGTELTASLRAAGHDVLRLVRSTPGASDVLWDPAAGTIERDKLPASTLPSISQARASGARWNDAKKRRIMESREKGTRLLAETLAALEPRPRVMVSMSGVGYYGAVRDDLLTDESSAGTGFLAEVCRAWEAGTQPAADAGFELPSSGWASC